MKVPSRLPRPPVMGVPPTTTAAIAFSSKFMPLFAGTSEKRTAFNTAATPVSAPIRTKTANSTCLHRNAGKARRFAIGAGGVDRAKGRKVLRGPPKESKQKQREQNDNGLPHLLTQAEPLKIDRQIFHPSTARAPAQ